VLFQLDGRDRWGFILHSKPAGAVHAEAFCPATSAQSSRAVADHWVAEINRVCLQSRPAAAFESAQSRPATARPHRVAEPNIGQTTEKVKLLIVGDSSVGKTMAARKFAGKGLDGASTIGVDFLTKKVAVNGKAVKLEMIDTAGQERFTFLTSSHYRDGKIFFVMFDLSSTASFCSCERWLQQIGDNCVVDSPIIFLIGNKRDLVDSRQISVETAAAFARDRSLSYFETSAELMASSVEYSEAENLACFEASQKSLDHVFEQALKQWDIIRPTESDRDTFKVGRDQVPPSSIEGRVVQPRQTCQC